jgi:hypothetical protein
LEHVSEACAESDDALNLVGRADAQGAGDLYCGAALAALCECDGIGAALVGSGVSYGAFCSIERSRHGALSRLCPELSLADPNSRHELNELHG